MIKLGEKIKALRHEKGISQEVLANNLGLSAQAVSKWEQGVTLPDVAMIPSIASYFGVSTDELFGFNLFKIEGEVKKICDEAYKFRFSDRKASGKILREGLKRFPGNEVILNNLLYVLSPEEDKEEYFEICNALSSSKDDETRFDAIRMMAIGYHRIDEFGLAKAAIDKLPEIYFTKLELQAWMLKGEERYRAASLQKNLSAETLVDMLCFLGDHYAENGEKEKAKIQYNIALRVINAFRDDFCDSNYFKCSLYEGLYDCIARIEGKITNLE
ncbi:MAG: helix-turn-helix domain-containing protein [Ruminococcaceae bacterium]|nr:helix-turn-helix domain-containing protein [Oscillospiraceae bacterium]